MRKERKTMAKITSRFVCQECGSVLAKWAGRCNQCGAWDTIIEECQETGFLAKSVNEGRIREFVPLEGVGEQSPRLHTGISELDRVLGGGLVPGAAILLGGDPGIGKSTLVLQLLASLAVAGKEVAYISGEESIEQIRLRAKRLRLEKSPVKLLAATHVKDIIASIDKLNKPDVIVVDSIQTMVVDTIASAPGTVSQVRTCSHELIRYAKSHDVVVVLVGHVTKEGQIAGPKVLEHMVDTVLYFEGERGHQFRILRAVKNRFGAANEIGVFEMQQLGLIEVPNPSALFLSNRESDVSGISIFAGMEGTRPVLIEVQALVMSTTIPTPRRAVVGWDANRLAMVTAILQTRYGVFLADKDIYLNITGGLKIVEPAADLAVAAALLSAVTNIALPRESIVFGELGLSGEVRMVAQSDMRIKEAAKLGFTIGLVPKGLKPQNKSFILQPIQHIRELAGLFKKAPQPEHV
jgi:DNA repair protein RadA/Sms